jgi:hypothetical protein
VRENQTIAVEDLAVKNMMKNHKLARLLPMPVGLSLFVSWNISASGTVEHWLRLTDGFLALNAADIAVTLLKNCRLMLGSGIAQNVGHTMTETSMPHKIFSPQGLR